MLDIRLNKFPELILDGKKIVWDLRQEISTKEEVVFITEEIVGTPSEDLLLSRAQKLSSLSVGPRNSKALKKVQHGGKALGEACALASHYSKRPMQIVGVTGTNGKTSTTALIRYLWSMKGYQCVQIGTTGISLWDGSRKILELESGWTTPSAPVLFDLFRQLDEAGFHRIAMEVSSHALSLGRVAGINFKAAIFTNLSQDHLDFHKSMEAYAQAKKSFFTEYLPQYSESPLVVLNAKEKLSDEILREMALGNKIELFELGNNLEVLEESTRGMRLHLNQYDIHTSLCGRFNAENIAAAFLAVNSLEDEKFSSPLHLLTQVPGRLELIAPDHAKKVYVDYAHTPDALEKVLSSLSRLKASTQKIWVVFGCGGDRDKLKRPEMGRKAEAIADYLVVTSDNPRSEDPQSIIDDILRGLQDSTKAKVFLDREEAIRFAITSMKNNDILLIAGKGHENYQIIGQSKKDFSDSEVALKYLK